MSYTKTTWTDGVTPLNATNMNNIENGIEEAMNSGGTKLYKHVLTGTGQTLDDDNVTFNSLIIISTQGTVITNDSILRNVLEEGFSSPAARNIIINNTHCMFITNANGLVVYNFDNSMPIEVYAPLVSFSNVVDTVTEL